MSDQSDLSQYMPEGWQGKYPPCEIQVNAEGELSHDGRPLVHPKVLADIFAAVGLEDGRYILTMDGKTCELEVDDTFFTVRRADEAPGGLVVTLNDGTSEEVPAGGVWLGENEMFYCQVKDGRFPARFSRPAYYQIAQKLEALDDGYALNLGGKLHPLGGGPAV